MGAGDDVVDEAVLQRLFGGEPAVAVTITTPKDARPDTRGKIGGKHMGTVSLP